MDRSNLPERPSDGTISVSFPRMPGIPFSLDASPQITHLFARTFM
jgi:hypothetical protein